MTVVDTDCPVPPPPVGSGRRHVRRETGPLRWGHIATVARTDLKQLVQAKDFWGPMVGLGAIFFCVVPTILLLSHHLDR